MKKSILYIQYTNPAGYPSLEHSSRLLAERGWSVEFLGTGVFGAGALRFPEHPKIRVRQMPFSKAGLMQKLHYARFCFWVFFSAVLGRPGWLYASDPLSCLPVYWLSFIFPGRVIYHEHDSPVPKNDERFFMKAILSSRSKLARRARLCILPNAERAEIFAGQMGDLKNVICVWNCPSLEELDRSEIKKTDEELQLFYHGTINPIRLPLTVLDAMALLPEKVRLRVVGYQTIGHPDYVDKLKARAASLGLQGRFEAIGAVPSRKELLGLCSLSHIGLAFMPKTTQDINERAMTGASNKPFEYLACGLALLVSNLPDWKGMFADAGFGRACDTDDPRSIADAVRWFLEHPEELKSMSSAGRQKIWDEWNYESQFEAVLRILESQNI